MVYFINYYSLKKGGPRVCRLHFGCKDNMVYDINQIFLNTLTMFNGWHCEYNNGFKHKKYYKKCGKHCRMRKTS